MIRLDVFAERRIWANGIALHLSYVQGGSEIRYVAKPLEFVALDGPRYTEPCCELIETTAQRLMDELWNCGLRPSEGTGSAGSLAATERHLKDMQRLVFKDKK